MHIITFLLPAPSNFLRAVPDIGQSAVPCQVGMLSPLLLSLLASSCLAVPRFEAYWESEASFLYNDDELHNPWYIDLGAIDAGGPGYIGGPNTVTIHAADYCVEGCQENYPDEFCSQYPPEGVPAKPRTVEDWGTKFNITANMMREGIDRIHDKGGKVNLAYGGSHWRLSNEQYLYVAGIGAENGGGSTPIYEDTVAAGKLATRIAKNVNDWNLDGVDFFYTSGLMNHYMTYEGDNGVTYVWPGNSANYHFAVIRQLRTKIPSWKTISVTATHSVDFQPSSPILTTITTVIAASHPYLDWITLGAYAINDNNLDAMAAFGIPLSKVGVIIDDYEYEVPVVTAAVEKIKERGLAGLSLFSINKENNMFRGEFARTVAELLYL